MKLLGPVNVVSLTVTDLARARAFYAVTLGLGEPWFDSEEMGWIEWGADGRNGNIAVTLPRDGSTGPGGGTTPVLQTPDAHALHTELVRRGVRCDPPVGVPGLLTYCTFHDPDGNRLQAVGPPPPAPPS